MNFTLLLAFATFAAPADSTIKPDKAHLVAGVTYNSALNYYGRTDSLKSSATLPFIGFTLDDGLYATATFAFIHNSLQSQYAATFVEAGYNFRNTKSTWAGNVSVSKFFYQGNTDLLQSAVKESAAFSLTHLDKVLDLTLAASLKHSDKLDYGAQAALDHIVRIPHIGKKGIIVIAPTATIYAGTQNFTQTYLQQKHVLFLPAGEETITKNSQSFNILAYELSIPVIFAYDKLQLIMNPSFIIPQNTLTTAPENGAHLFYLSSTIKLTL